MSFRNFSESHATPSAEIPANTKKAAPGAAAAVAKPATAPAEAASDKKA